MARAVPGVRRGASMAAMASLSLGGIGGIGGIAAVGHSTATNLSGNPYFPLVVGAQWTYKEASGPAATLKTRVTGSAKTAAGTVVDLRISSTSATVTASYLIGHNGNVEFQGGAAGSSRTSFSGSGQYFLPDAAQVTSCHPCTFTSTVTTTAGGLSMHGHLVETVTSIGMQHVHVPAGSFIAEKLLLSIKLTTTGTPMALETTTSFYDFLAKNVGVVESGGGTVTSTVAGHSFRSSTGTEQLVRYTA